MQSPERVLRNVMVDPGPGRAGRTRGILAAVVAVLTMLVMTLGGALQPAQAATPNSGIIVGPASIQRVEDPANGQATVGDTLKVTGSWDATDANPQPGDTFTIGLPTELSFPASVPINLVGDGGAVWGTCLTDPGTQSALCTLTDAVLGHDDVKGEWSFEVTAVKATDQENVTFDFNGKDGVVDLLMALIEIPQSCSSEFLRSRGQVSAGSCRS